MEKIIELDNEDTMIEALPSKQQTFGEKRKDNISQTENVNLQQNGSEYDIDSKSNISQ